MLLFDCWKSRKALTYTETGKLSCIHLNDVQIIILLFTLGLYRHKKDGFKEREAHTKLQHTFFPNSKEILQQSFTTK